MRTSARPGCAARTLLAPSFLILIALFSAPVLGQTEDFVGRWEKTFPVKFKDAVVDPSGNLDLAFSDWTGNTFLRQLDNHGNTAWTALISSGSVEIAGIACDATTNVYLVGSFAGTAVVNGDTLVIAGADDIFVTSFTSTGAGRFSRSWGTAADDEGQAVAVANSGDILIGAISAGALDMGGGPLPPLAGASLIVARFDASITYRWSNRYPPERGEFANASSITTDATNAAYVTFNYGSHSVDDWGVVFDFKAASLMKLDPLGAEAWRWSGAYISFADVAVDPTGNIDVLAEQLVEDFGIYMPASIFVDQFSPGGQVLWDSYIPNQPDIGIGNGMCADAAGNIYIGRGRSSLGAQGNILISSLDRFGSSVWSQEFQGTGSRSGLRCGIASDGELILVGAFSGTITLNDQSYSSVSDQDVFVIKGPPPVKYEIGAITDVAGDQGGWVHVPFTRANHDLAGARNEVTGYQVLLQGSSPLWTVAGYTTAAHSNQYEVIAMTAADSTITNGLYRSRYKIRSLTANPNVFFDSAPASGYSVDNLKPHAPTNFTYANRSLAWIPYPDPDVAYYSIYGSTVQVFGPSAVFIAQATSSPMDVTQWAYPFYFITATDDAGNVSIAIGVEGEADTTAPGAPIQLVYDGGVLRWQPPADVDVDKYAVFGSMVDTLEPSSPPLSEASTLICDVRNQPFAYYFVTAVDFAGNRSAASRVKDNVAPAAPTGVVYDGKYVTWMQTTDPGFDHYMLYTAYSGDFTARVIFKDTTEPRVDVTGFGLPYYFVTVVDHAGNESAPASVKDQVAPLSPSRLAVRSAMLSWKPVDLTPEMTYDVYGSNDDALDSDDELIVQTGQTSLSIREDPYPYYIVEAVDVAQNRSAPAIVRVDPKQAYPVVLAAYPNPFNPETTIRCDIPARGHLLVALYDARGQQVAILANEERNPGSYSIPWNGATSDGGRAGSGVYFARLQHPAGTKTLKIVLVR